MPRACVIGAGSSGLAAGKALKDAGVAFDIFESSDRVGGLGSTRTAMARRRPTAACIRTHPSR